MPEVTQVAPRGAVWSYNNAGFNVAGRVIEVVTGRSINRAISDLVFAPLGLEHAGTSTDDFIVNRFAAGHTTGPQNRTVVNRPYRQGASVAAGGIGLCITDLMTYARFHMGDGTAANGARVLTRTSMEHMLTPQFPKQVTENNMGIAWHLRTVGPLRVAAHGGMLKGHVVLLDIVPERNFAIGILTNADTGWRLIQDVERAALEIYHRATFAPNQAIAHRGLVETLPTARPLTTQPDLSPYVGRYLRRMKRVDVRSEGSTLFVQETPNGGKPRAEMPVSFYSPDRAMVTAGSDRGQSIEFIRNANGSVKWVRVRGRVAARK
jgi:CubicO group peptidase (beta-lactamase class C family)